MNVQTRPDIFLIVLDTLRADRLSCYGYSRETSPRIDTFAEEGVLFERAISPAQWTIPSHASLFTGEYPSTHMTTQIYDRHSPDHALLAEVLKREGYLTVGFCNNPLLGVVENDLDRGFDEFYNYGGAVPNRPPIVDSRPRRIGRFAQYFSRILRQISRPIQTWFARSDLLLRLALVPWIAPLWQGNINFKGNSVLSLRDIVGYLRTRQRRRERQPLFVFVNLMETHLPYRPLPRFIRRFAPYYRNDREARDFMHHYNRQHYRWMIPMTEPLTELQSRVLNDLYDAEIAYEDHLLRGLFRYLQEPGIKENSLVFVTSDHGEGMNNHHFVGHSLVAYDDLIRVPLIVRCPRLFPSARRVSRPVSARRIFHTALEAAGVDPDRVSSQREAAPPVEVQRLSLSRALNGTDEENEIMTEAYTPKTLITLMKNHDPRAIETFRCHLMRRAVYRDRYKLISVGDQPDELFDMIDDPGEQHNLLDEKPDLATELYRRLETLLEEAEGRRPANWQAKQLQLEEDAAVTERLRGLGYLE